MEYKLSNRVKELCRQRGMQLKDLAQKMNIAPESLSRAINGNPQLSTLTSIAVNLDVAMADLFPNNNQATLNAIVLFNNKTYTAQNLAELEAIADEIKMEAQDKLTIQRNLPPKR